MCRDSQMISVLRKGSLSFPSSVWRSILPFFFGIISYFSKHLHLGHYPLMECSNILSWCTQQRKNAENLKQKFPEKEYHGFSPNFHIHVSVSELYIPTMGLPFLLEEICGPTLQYIKRSQTHACGNRSWGRAIPRKGISLRNSRCSVFAYLQSFVITISNVLRIWA